MANTGNSERVIPQADMNRMVSLIHRNARTFALDLSGFHVVVPAAAGYLGAAATFALVAGAASVTAITPASTRFRSAEEAAATTQALASLAGVGRGLTISERIDDETCRVTNVLINDDPIRPVTRSLIERLPDRAVIALMHEPWMLLHGDVDLDAADEHGVAVSAINESHPLVGGSLYRPALCLTLLEAAEVTVDQASVALICDNPLANDLERGLREAGAQVAVFPSPETVVEHPWTVVVLAQRPSEQVRLGIRDLGHIAKAVPGALIVQYWGDIDRKAARYFELRVWPPRTPGRGQWGMPLDVLGAEPNFGRIAGAFRSAQAILSGEALTPEGLAQIVTLDESFRDE